MRPMRSVLTLFLIGFCGNALAQVTFEQPNETVSGERLFGTCVFCHGTEAQGNDRRDGPAIAGLPTWYIELQMKNFRDGIRGGVPEDLPGQVMHFTRGLMRDDATIARVAEYVSGLESGLPMAGNAIGARPYIWDAPYAGLDPSITGNADAGQQTYSTICVACHGADGIGNELLGAADLRFLSEIYMARQLMYFRDGIRGAHPQDTRGAQMAVMAKILTTDQAVADVIAYIQTL
jgi:cytochrome c oxidase subunit 2